MTSPAPATSNPAAELGADAWPLTAGRWRGLRDDYIVGKHHAVTEQIPSSFFLTDGDGFVATALSRGPWDDGSAHGGPVAALIGQQVERHDPDPELVTVRLTIELIRPVPLGHLDIVATTLRPGKRVRLIGASVIHDGAEVARAVVLRVRRTPDDVPLSAPGPIEFLAPQDSGPAPSLVEGRIHITDGIELRTAGGSAIEPGPAIYWFRVHRPLVDDEPITPLTRALIAADFGNGIASVLSLRTHLFINPELTVHLHRLPEGEWVANDAHTWLHPGGAAVAEATLADATSAFGRAMQTLYIASR